MSCDEDDWQRRLVLPAKSSLCGECVGHAWRLADGKVQWEAAALAGGDRAGARGRARRLAAAFVADFLKDGPRMWGVIDDEVCMTMPKTTARTSG